jgi:hypothetical protein
MVKELITTFKKIQEETYSLENHITTYEDYDELHFINKELYFYQNCFSTANVHEGEYWEYNSDYQDYKYVI